MKPFARMFYIAGAAFCLSGLGSGQFALANGAKVIHDEVSSWQRCQLLFKGANNKLKLAAVKQGIIANLPDHWPVARVATHSYVYRPGLFDKPVSVTLVSDVPLPNNETMLLDLNHWPSNFRPPDKFLISDGSMRRSILGIDLAPQSPLSRWLDKIVDHIDQRLGNQRTLNEVLELLRDNVANFMGPVRNGSDGTADLGWDKAIESPMGPLNERRVNVFESIHEVKGLGASLRVEPLESYIEHGQGYCLQQSALSWLILRRMGYNARLVNGSTATEVGTSYGHAWVMVDDGRILDPAHKILELPMRRTYENEFSMPYPTGLMTHDWMYFRSHKTVIDNVRRDTWRFEFSRFPILVQRNDPLVPETYRPPVGKFKRISDWLSDFLPGEKRDGPNELK